MGRLPLFAGMLAGASIGCGPAATAGDSGTDGRTSGEATSTDGDATTVTSIGTSEQSTSSSSSSATEGGESSSTSPWPDDESSSTGAPVIPSECGDGVFDPRNPYCYADPVVLDPAPAFDIALADMTDDDVLDVVAATEGGLTVFPGIGDDTFGVGELHALPCTPTRIVVGDIDLTPDPHSEVAVICPDDDALVVLYTLDGEPRVQLPIVETGDTPVDLVFDIDWESGIAGYAVAESGAGTVTRYVLDAGGELVIDRVFDVGGRPNAIAVADQWLAIADADADTVSIHWFSPDASPQQATHTVHADPVHLRASWFGDIGGPKLMVVAAGDDELTIYEPEGDALTEQQSATFPGGPVHFDVGRQAVDVEQALTPIIVVARDAGTVALSPANSGESFHLQPPEVTIDVGPEPVAVLAVTRNDMDDLFIASAVSGVLLLRADP